MGRAVEYIGVGVWPGKETAPDWDAESLTKGFLDALSGETADSMRQNAKAMRQVAESYGGRITAAKEVARLAAMGDTP
jgi:hypothetical protein